MSKVIIKTAAEIELMRLSGQLLAKVFAKLDGFMAEGITTMAINDFVERYIVDELNARPASKGQYGYQYSLNTSVNDVVCHGIPNQVPLQQGDIVNVDITLEKNGFIADSSKMYLIGQCSVAAERLCDMTYQAMWQGIKKVKAGATLGDIGFAIASFAHQNGYSVVKEYCGHGIGAQMHEAPQVLHYGRMNTGLVLEPGMTFTIEPMINQGKAKIKNLKDGWTVVTADKKLSAQWEHTILVTDTGYEVLTLRAEETLA
ncbi:type I methionyl aminopeptidase [Pseudoalteromonas tunicata]|jgi:methionyl aminopeptidase|uniref:Methionine aminopeptidase n=1 Tax=Pseudoalteromonas tunicata D2 TaxID=87626 RepID=A4CF04_9GAMM|nr:type I methionyl aminopeptidase [Pseudoalteromonas tunicata]ATC96144.1 methionyl aminopeptidase [Pseudoalteromonas tunicata]AXT31662.1 type I methionyl aminopeptidase [Pseudoalteromonas tunicata]EAR26679.1 methionine aminopeptidase, MAP [Pseudoalteromonas tunicata D2]